MSVEFEEERDTFILKEAGHMPRNVSKMSSMHFAGHPSVESTDAVGKYVLAGFAMKNVPNSHRGTLQPREKSGSKLLKQESMGSVMNTSSSRETNLQGQGEFGKKIFKHNSYFDSKHGHFYIPDEALSSESDFVSFGDRLRIFCLYIAFLFYTSVIVFLGFVLDEELITKVFGETNEVANLVLEHVHKWYFYFTFAPIVALLLVKYGGKYMLSGAFYPYQNSFAREDLDRQNATKFGIEFGHYLGSLVYTLRI
jgi:hypothetical protein